MAGKENSIKAILYALCANFGIAVAKGIAAFITQSGSMLAETIHSLADCTNQLLLLFGMKKSQHPPDDAHPLGYGKVVYFWSFIVAMLLFTIGGLFSIYEGVHKLSSHEPIQKAWLALLILGISIILELGSLFGALREIKHVRREKAFSKWLKTTRSSELLVILGEDIAAVLGLILAFIFVLLADLFNQPFFDALGSICIGVVLLIVSVFLIIRMKSLLIGKSADPDIRNLIERELETDDNIQKVFNVLTLQIGPYIMLAAKIKLKSGIDVEKACNTINRLEKELKETFPEIKWSFVEPDISD